MAYKHKYIDAGGTYTLGGPDTKLHSINVTYGGATGPRIYVYDNTAGSGTLLANFYHATAQPSGSFLFDVYCSTGLTLVVSGTTAPYLTVSYE